MASVIPQTAAPTIATRMFTPDSLLPDQIGWAPVATPEQRLLIAVLEEALHTLQLHARVASAPKIARAYFDTVRWFLSDDESGAFTFRGMCAHLGSGWEPDCVLAGLRAQGLPPLMPPHCPSEHQEQVAVMTWRNCVLRTYPALALLYASQAGARVAWRQAKRLKAEGMPKGIPDLHLPVARQGFHGLWLEMKRERGGTVSPDQKWWHSTLRAEGHRVEVCRGARAGIVVLEDYLRGGDPVAKGKKGKGGKKPC